ncbi:MULTISPECIES: tyrosine-type recombinase/integrase [Nocardia]|uniref:tyrosine-type recombinase/integrase n=1 Tax=Nocardia TaxID=1817 RepID=UPI000D69E0F2|nr:MULTISPECIES: site-specific integrase [Nocardia]
MTASSPSPVTAETLAAARLLLTQMGISPADLVAPGTAVPTFAEVIPRVRARLSPGTLRTYDTHFTHLLTHCAERRLDEPEKAEFEDMARRIQTEARTNRASRGGTGAAENFVSALRCIYRFAEDSGWIRPVDNPARRIARPTRRPSHRYAIGSDQLAEIWTAAATTGDDPDFDALVLRLHIETACRRSGSLTLGPHDLDPDQCLIFLREKDGSDRWQPVSPTLMRGLMEHTAERGSPRAEQLLRYHDGRPITSRRYDHIWHRIGEELPWAAAQGVSIHWLRHTTLTWVERTFSYAVAREYAGHRGKNAGVTATYVKAHLHEIAAALAVLTGETHPLAPAVRHNRPDRPHAEPTIEGPRS